MKTSEKIDLIASALSKAQSEMKPASKDSENPFFHSKYSDLESCWEVARGPLTKHGLSLTQVPGISVDGKPLLETMLMHSSGQFILGEMPLTPVKADPQSMGSIISYFRRYALSAMLGVVSGGEDDDGNQAQGRPAAPPAQRPVFEGVRNPGWQKEPATTPQKRRLWAMAKELGYEEVDVRAVADASLKRADSLKSVTKGEIQSLFEKFQSAINDSGAGEIPEKAE